MSESTLTLESGCSNTNNTFSLNDDVYVINYENPWKKNVFIDKISGKIMKFEIDPYDVTLTIKGARIKINDDEILDEHINDGKLGSVLKEENSYLWIPLKNLVKCY